MASGAHDLAEPDEGASREAMRRALEDAGIAPSSIDYVNAHGAGTVRDDLEETRAVREVFGKHAYALAVSSTKSMHGHALGAAPAFEAVACVKAIETGIVPPTIGLDDPDPECDLDYVPRTARDKKLSYAMSNSFGLGAMDASVIFGAAP
jgi:nodulation protein E